MPKYLDETGLGYFWTKLKTYISNATVAGISGVLPVENGGSGLSSSPSILVNLSSQNATDVFKGTPRPGVTGILPIGRGGTGVGSVRASTVINDLIEAGSGFTISSINYCYWGRVATVNLAFKKSTAGSATTYTIGTLKSGYRPRYSSPGNFGWDGNAVIGLDGAIKVNSALSANTTYHVYATFVMAEDE